MTVTVDARPAPPDAGVAPVDPVHPSGTDVVDVPVHYARDGDGTWSFRVDNPSLLGGGLPTRAAAERAAVEALARALRGGRHAPRAGEVTGHICVALRAVWDGEVAAPAPRSAAPRVDTVREVLDLLMATTTRGPGRR